MPAPGNALLAILVVILTISLCTWSGRGTSNGGPRKPPRLG